MEVRIGKKQEIKVGDLVDFNRDGDYRLICMSVKGEYQLFDPKTCTVTTTTFPTLEKLIKDHNLTLVAKAEELGLVRLIDIEDNNK